MYLCCDLLALSYDFRGDKALSVDKGTRLQGTRLSGVSPHEKSSPVLGELPEGVRG